MKCTISNKIYLSCKKLNFIRGICEIRKLEPKMLVFTMIYGVISAIYPFISIYGISIIVDDLMSKDYIVYRHIFVLIAVNSLFYVLNNISRNCFFNSRRVMFINEKRHFTNVVVELKKRNYNELELKKICNKENSIIKHQSSNPLFMICKLLYDFISGLTNVFFTFFIVRNVFSLHNNSYYITSSSFSIVILFLTLSMIIMVGAISAIISKKLSKTNSDFLDSLTKFDYYWDYFNDFETIKSIRIFKGTNLIVKSVKSIIERNTFKLLEKKSSYFAKQGALISTTGALLAFFIYILIGIKCYIGMFSIGELTRYISGFMQIIQGGMLIANGVGQIIYLNDNLKYYFRMLDIYNISQLNTQSKTSITKTIDKIEFKDVYYKYSNSSEYTLQNINLEISGNQKIAIVGENGAGKTTFIKLLLGIIRPTKGNIYINGIDLNTIETDSYIKNFSTMYQDFFLPSFSINEIITGSKDKTCDDKILYAANCMTFLENVSLTDTYLGNEYNPNGINFSGGEKQKIAFARALHKDCNFYILDEPSSAMDAISEYNFFNGINEYLKNKCIMYISHRLFSCAYSDRILVFKDGLLVEDDSFNKLHSDKKSFFNKLWYKQSNQYNCTQINTKL